MNSSTAELNSSNSSTASESKVHQVIFSGTTTEFFTIWIVNIVLSILTLGIYSAWAKVRTKRYFYTNTSVAGGFFEYHANPVSILISRIIILIFGVAVFLLTLQLPSYSFFINLLPAILLPWAIVRGLSFNARYSSYRRIRFAFNREYLFLYLFALAYISVIGLLLLPWLIRGYHKFIVNHHQLGNTKFVFAPPPILKYVLATYSLVLLIIVLFALVFIIFVQNLSSASEASSIIIYIPIFYLSFLVPFFISQSVLLKLFWDNIRTESGASIDCTIAILPFAIKILLVNFFAKIFSLGLLYPWTAIRKADYLAKHTFINDSEDLINSISGADSRGQEGAFGEEFASDGFDFDVGVL